MQGPAPSHGVRPAAQAGRFYPGSASALGRAAEEYLKHAVGGGLADPKAVIAPHAGYRYSGPIAGSAFAPWSGNADRIRRVVILGPTHSVDFQGIALPGFEAMATPLGEVPVDTESVAALAALPHVRVLPEAHASEHAIEVELPFLQVLFPAGFRIVPLVVGRETDAGVAAVIETLWGGPETRFVLSSDLSHYLTYPEAREIDGQTAEAIERRELQGVTASRACGCRPIRGFLLAADRRQLKGRIVDLRNSGDTAGSRDSVVGSGAFHFGDEPPPAISS